MSARPSLDTGINCPLQSHTRKSFVDIVLCKRRLRVSLSFHLGITGCLAQLAYNQHKRNLHVREREQVASRSTAKATDAAKPAAETAGELRGDGTNALKRAPQARRTAPVSTKERAMSLAQLSPLKAKRVVRMASCPSLSQHASMSHVTMSTIFNSELEWFQDRGRACDTLEGTTTTTWLVFTPSHIGVTAESRLPDKHNGNHGQNCMRPVFKPT